MTGQFAVCPIPLGKVRNTALSLALPGNSPVIRGLSSVLIFPRQIEIKIKNQAHASYAVNEHIFSVVPVVTYK